MSSFSRLAGFALSACLALGVLPGIAIAAADESGSYVDGFYAGIVDDFDGVFQDLPPPPGERSMPPDMAPALPPPPAGSYSLPPTP